MPRFEMYLMFAEDDDGNVEASEIEMVCWVNDPSDLREVQDVANEAIQIHLNEAENPVLFGTALIMVKGKEVLSIGFRNKDADPDEVGEIIELFGIKEETIH
jgi:hypothetical protein|tara:strand:- start:2615 stop:2920 length:306 start_codon:yes stop_codon:yes gene_type:complete